MLHKSLTSFISVKEISNEYNHQIVYLIIQLNDYTTSPNHLLIQYNTFLLHFISYKWDYFTLFHIQKNTYAFYSEKSTTKFSKLLSTAIRTIVQC